MSQSATSELPEKRRRNEDYDDDESGQTGGARGKSKKGRKSTTGSKQGKTSRGKTSGSKTSKKGKKGHKISKTSRGGAGTHERDDDDDGSYERTKRYFKAIDSKTGQAHGRYTGGTPKQAASKAFSQHVRKLETKGRDVPDESKIYLRESTRGSARKVYGYKASRLELNKPQKHIIQDKDTGQNKTIVYKYRNSIGKIQVPDGISSKLTTSRSKSSSKGKGGKSSRKGSESKGAKKGTKSSSRDSKSKKSKAKRKKSTSKSSKSKRS